MPERLRRVVATAVVLLASAGCAPDAAAPVPGPGPTGPATTAPTTTPSASTPPSPAPVSPAPVSSTPVSPTPSTTPATTAVYAADLKLSGDQLDYIELRWFWGAKAQAECNEKGISSPSSWCNDYYFEKTGRTGEAVLASDAKIKILNQDGKLKKGTPVQVQQAIEDDFWPNFRIWRSGDRVVRLEQVFTP